MGEEERGAFRSHSCLKVFTCLYKKTITNIRYAVEKTTENVSE